MRVGGVGGNGTQAMLVSNGCRSSSASIGWAGLLEEMVIELVLDSDNDGEQAQGQNRTEKNRTERNGIEQEQEQDQDEEPATRTSTLSR